MEWRGQERISLEGNTDILVNLASIYFHGFSYSLDKCKMWPFVSFTLNGMKQFRLVAQKSNNIFTKWLTVNPSGLCRWKYSRECWLFIPHAIGNFIFYSLPILYLQEKDKNWKKKKIDETSNFSSRSETSSTILWPTQKGSLRYSLVQLLYACKNNARVLVKWLVQHHFIHLVSSLISFSSLSVI